MILIEWQSITAEQPWLSIPEDRRIDMLPALVTCLLEGMMGPAYGPDSHRRLVEAAIEHGKHRRDSALPDQDLFTEYHRLRMAMWRELQRRALDNGENAVRGIMSVDVAIRVAIRASLAGYHRAEFEACGAWDRAVSDLEADLNMLASAATANK